MPRITRIDHGPRNGVWPNGEPQSVRDAYDAMLAAEKAAKDSKDDKTTKR